MKHRPTDNANAMILAAGRGERLRPLTDTTPKPLLEVGGKPIIQWQIEALARAGFSRMVINVSWLAQQFIDTLSDGHAFGVDILWSLEHPTPLETAGGIAHAKHLFADAPIVIVSGDLWHAFDYQTLLPIIDHLKTKKRGAHLVMVENPDYHLSGDFLFGEGKLHPATPDNLKRYPKLTFGNIGVYTPELFAALDPNQPRKLAPLLSGWIDEGIVSAERFDGLWRNIGTVEELNDVRQKVFAQK
ncbi:MAG: nucleotidyltransferase family protein [Burkholderiales bacterium]|jgi:MurNAc alpha-1-phosphate uridylyltransferase|nr:nucleotidyltransferase family protein [Burkholderiales bacterium]